MNIFGRRIKIFHKTSSNLSLSSIHQVPSSSIIPSSYSFLRPLQYLSPKISKYLPLNYRSYHRSLLNQIFLIPLSSFQKHPPRPEGRQFCPNFNPIGTPSLENSPHKSRAICIAASPPATNLFSSFSTISFTSRSKLVFLSSLAQRTTQFRIEKAGQHAREHVAKRVYRVC